MKKILFLPQFYGLRDAEARCLKGKYLVQSLMFGADWISKESNDWEVRGVWDNRQTLGFYKKIVNSK